MCQFHQVAITRRYLIQNTEIQAYKQLLKLSYGLCHTDKESFIGALNEWCERWSACLKERKNGKSHYTHRRVRSAYLSLKRNMSNRWTWYDNPDVEIPNTNNGLEGKFPDLKSKLRNHNGISKKHRMVFMDGDFKETYRSECAKWGKS